METWQLCVLIVLIGGFLLAIILLLAGILDAIGDLQSSVDRLHEDLDETNEDVI